MAAMLTEPTQADPTTAPARRLPEHTPMQQFPLRDGQLVVGGELLTTLAARVGQTPFYAYDRGLLRQRVAQLRAALPAAVKLHYAMKANPMPAVVGLMAGLVDGIDVASAGELALEFEQAGVDALHLETCCDASELRAVLTGVREATPQLPLLVSVTVSVGQSGLETPLGVPLPQGAEIVSAAAFDGGSSSQYQLYVPKPLVDMALGVLISNVQSRSRPSDDFGYDPGPMGPPSGAPPP